MKHPFYEWLQNENLASESEILAMEDAELKRPFSLFREVNFLLYAGILVVGSGLGVLIYNNIDTIGHLALILGIFFFSMASLVYAHLKYGSYTVEKLNPPGLLLPYLVLLGITLFMLLEGYIEYQYKLFEGNYNIPSILAAAVCFVAAYRFDHEGILSIALATLVASIGLTILPQKWFLGNVDFNQPLFFMGILMGFIIILGGYFLSKKGIKIHFEPTYANVGGFLLLACLLGLQFKSDFSFLAVVTLIVCFGLFLYARVLKSIGLYVVLILAGYCTFTSLYFELGNADLLVFSIYTYVPLSLTGVAYLLIKFKKFLKIPA